MISSKILKSNLYKTQKETNLFYKKYKKDLIKLEKTKLEQKVNNINKILKENEELKNKLKILSKKNDYLYGELNKKIQLINSMKNYIQSLKIYIRNNFSINKNTIGNIWS
tara:strand:- start:225 stop:554 length:330 start_codon:yes stop_codon:yes gene_type:complete